MATSHITRLDDWYRGGNMWQLVTGNSPKWLTFHDISWHFRLAADPMNPREQLSCRTGVVTNHRASLGLFKSRLSHVPSVCRSDASFASPNDNSGKSFLSQPTTRNSFQIFQSIYIEFWQIYIQLYDDIRQMPVYINIYKHTHTRTYIYIYTYIYARLWGLEGLIFAYV